MSKAIRKKNIRIPKKARAEMQKYGVVVQVGDMVIDMRSNPRVYEVAKLTNEGVEIGYYNEDGKWRQYGVIEYNRFNRDYIVMDKTLEEYHQELHEFIADPDAYVSKLDDSRGEIPSDAIVAMNAQVDLVGMRDKLQNAERRMEILRSVMEMKQAEMRNAISIFRQKIEVITKVVTTLEIYMGIDEEITQIRSGQPAGQATPISFRQQILFMDEELGDPDDGGLDWRRISEFDKWVATGKNVDVLLPEQKGVIVLKPRRSKKDYTGGKDPLLEWVLNQENFRTYILIRNGENLYRICGQLSIKQRLFPKRDELDPKKRKGDSWFFGRDLEELSFEYKQSALMLQGLIDRTQVFDPKPPGMSVFDPKCYGRGIVMIADDELTITDGRPTYKEWLEGLNAKIAVGTRIVYVNLRSEHEFIARKHYADRFDTYFNEWNVPPLPSTGLYSVVSVGRKRSADRTDENAIKVIYNPKDVVTDKSWRNWRDRNEDHTRKRGLGYWFYKHERGIFNYDLLDLADVEYYLASRVNRHDYANMIPVLREIKQQRLKELEWERNFVRLLAGRIGEGSEDAIWKAIEWWKRKVIWKRPITKEDAKALRMIEARVRRQPSGATNEK